MMQSERTQVAEREIQLSSIVRLLWKKAWFILACGAMAAVLAYLYVAIFFSPSYVAKATLYANNRDSSKNSTSITTSDMNASAKLVDVYSAIILSDPVLDQVILENHLNTTPSRLAKSINIESVNSTEVFCVKVIDKSPAMAAQIANSIATLAPDKIAQIVDGCSIKLVSLAKVPTEQVTQNADETVIQGLSIGLGVGIMLVLVVAMLDTRIKSEADLNNWNIPVIGSIPAFADAEKWDVRRYERKGDERE